MIDIVITRHEGLVKYLIDEGLISAEAEVISHASAELVEGKNVIGVLPHSLSCLCNSYTEIPLNLPADMRGKELTVEDVRKYAGKPATYKVNRIQNED